MEVLIGVDPHKVTNAVAAVNERGGELLEHANFATDREPASSGPSSTGL